MKAWRKYICRGLRLLLIVIVFSGFYLVFYNLLCYATAFPWGSLYDGFIDYLGNFMPILLLTICNVFIIFRLWRNTIVEKHLPVKICADLLVSFLALYLTNNLYLLLTSTTLYLDVLVIWTGTVLCNLLLFMGIEIAYYVKRSKEALRKAESAKREALQYQYESLKATVNPHFLFNSLNILLSLTMTDPKKSYDFTMELASIYRYIVSIQNKSKVSLREELQFLQSYTSILRIRYDNNLSVIISGNENCGYRQIVPFSLQLMIENVTKHNDISSRQPMVVNVDIAEEHITVSNPVRPKLTESPSGIGHKYVAQQYRTYGKIFRIARDGNTFTAFIPYLE